MQRVAVSVGVVAQHAGCGDGQRHAGMGAVVVVMRHRRRVGDVNRHRGRGGGRAVAHHDTEAGVAAEACCRREAEPAVGRLHQRALQAGGVDAEHRQRVIVGIGVIGQHTVRRVHRQHLACVHRVSVVNGHWSVVHADAGHRKIASSRHQAAGDDEALNRRHGQLRVAQLHPNGRGTWLQVGEPIAAVSGGERGALVGIEAAVAVGIDVDTHTCHRGFASVATAVGVGVGKHGAGHAAQLEVAKLGTGDGVARRQHQVVHAGCGLLRHRCVATATAAAGTGVCDRGLAQLGDGRSQFDHVEAPEGGPGVDHVVDLIVTIDDGVAGGAQERGELAGAQATPQGLVRNLLSQGCRTRDKRCRLAGALHGGDATMGIGAVEARTGGKGVDQIGAALRERGDLVSAGGVVGGTGRDRPWPAEVGGPGGPHRNCGRVAGRVGHAHLAELQVVVAGGGDHDHIGLGERCEFVAYAVAGKVIGPVAVVAQREVDHVDVIRLTVGQHPLQCLLKVGKGAAAGVLEHLERNQVGGRGHARVHAVLRADDAGDVGAVAVHVAGVGVVVGKVPLIDDAVVHAVAVQVGPEEGVVDVDAGVDHHRGGAAPVQRAVAGLAAQAGDGGGLQCGIHRQLAVVDHGRTGGGGRGVVTSAVSLEVDGRAGRGHARAHGVGQRLGLDPAVALQLRHHVGAGQQVRKMVVTQRVGQGRDLAAVEHAIGIGVQEDGPALHAALACVMHAVAVQVVELHAADAAQLHIAKVSRDHHAAAQTHRCGRGAAPPAGLRHLSHFDRGRAQVIEAERAVDPCDHADLASIEHAVGVGIQEDRPARQRCFTGVAGAVVVQVAELHAIDVRGQEVAKVGPADRVTGHQGDVIAAGGGRGLQPVGWQRLTHSVVAGRQAVEHIAAVSQGQGRDLARVELVVAVGVEINRAPGDTGLGVVGRRVVAAAAVQVFVHPASDRGGQAGLGGPGAGLVAQAHVAGQVSDARRTGAERVSARRGRQATQAAHSPLRGAELRERDASVKQHGHAVSRQGQVAQVNGGRGHGFVESEVQRVHTRGAWVGRGRGD